MKIFLTNQSQKFKSHLDILKKCQVMKYNKSDLKETITIKNLETNKKLNELDLQFLFDYLIFPEKIMSYYVEWKDENRKMKIGDTIVQQVYLPPILYFSQKIIFGVRINEIIHEENRIGFSYETLDGHVEKGVSTFTIELISDKLIAKIHTFSSSGNILTKLLGPIFSVPYQKYCTKLALNNIKQQIDVQ